MRTRNKLQEREKEKTGKKVEDVRISLSSVHAHADAREERKRGEGVEADRVGRS